MKKKEAQMEKIRFVFRMLKRNPLMQYIAIPGLAIGLGAVLLLTVYLKHELSFDKHFATKDRVLRLYNKVNEGSHVEFYPICLRQSYLSIPENVPDIEAAVQFYRGWGVDVKKEDKYYASLELLYADPGFFDVFGLNLIYGNKNDALTGERKVVLTSSTALTIFNNLDCIGQALSIENEEYIVSGVMKDLPATTHFNFDLLVSMETMHPENFGGLELFTYFLIRENAGINNAAAQIVAQNNGLMKPWQEGTNWQVESGTELLRDLHLYTKVDMDLSPTANLVTISIVVGIALFVLLISLINYINLYMLHGEKRIKEISVRRFMGAGRKSLSLMFCLENGAVSIIAFVLATGITVAVLPFFADLMQRQMTLPELFSPAGLLIVAGLLLLVTIVPVVFSNLYFSRIRLSNGMKGQPGMTGRKTSMSVSSVLVQFTVTVILLSSLFVIHRQVRYLKNIPVGFNTENVIGISRYNPETREQNRTIYNEMARLPFVESVGSSNHRMGGGASGQSIRAYGSPDNRMSIDEYRVQPGFCETMQLGLLEGRFFTDDEKDKDVVILNKAATAMLGIESLATGAFVEFFGKRMEVIGIVKDFYHSSHPGEKIAPLMLSNYSNWASHLYLRISGNFTPDKQAMVSSILDKYNAEFIFDHYRLGDTYSAKFEEEDRVARLVTAGSYIAILLSFMGLMALSLMNVMRRTKEIGIRKIVGSTVTEVMWLLLRQSVIIVAIACVIAFFPARMMMERWLADFYDRIPLHAGYFIASGLSVLLIAIAAVGFQSRKAAARNPVESLRHE